MLALEKELAMKKLLPWAVAAGVAALSLSGCVVVPVDDGPPPNFCPPGQAKKGNCAPPEDGRGFCPPGQAKKGRC